MITKEREQKEINIDENKQKTNSKQLLKETRNTSNLLLAAGIIEIILGVVAMIAAAFTGVVFAVLLGAAIVIGGVIEIIASIGRNNLAGVAVGLIATIAGALVIAQPLAGLNFLTLLVAIYLVGTGVARLFGRARPTWTRVGGAIGIILGIVVLIFLPSISSVLIGLIVGVNILIDGILTTRASMDLRHSIYM